MSDYFLKVTLQSDTTFGRGDGVAGWIDSEVEHDELGLPFLRGRALKGLLAEECENILFSLEKQQNANLPLWRTAKENLFGKGGSKFEDNSQVKIGNAVLSEDLRQAVKFAIRNNQFSADEVLKSLTTIRRQTAMTEKGAPKKDSLRSFRAILRETVLTADVDFKFVPDDKMRILLGISAVALQRAGSGRNRGRGKISVELLPTDTDWIEEFEKSI